MNTGVPKKKEKRGRKPKNNISAQKPPAQIYNKSNNTKIVKIKPSKHAEQIQGYDTDNNQWDEIVQSTDNPKVCWNCHNSLHEFIGIPVECVNNVYIVQGTFCSLPCAARYIFDTYDNNDLWRRYTLLNMYYNQTHGTVGLKVKPAPHKHHLLEFGGRLTRDEYLSENTGNSIILPPIIPINNYICVLDTNVQCKSLGDLKLYRKKPIKTNHVLDKMTDNKSPDSE